MNRRILIIVSCALVLSLCVSYLVYRAVSVKAGPGRAAQTIPLVVAARDLEAGSLIRDIDLKTISWAGSLPKGASSKPDALRNRGIASAIYEGEPVTENRLAGAGSGGGLAGTIPAGMRACAVKVNEVVGVAGFVVPGMRVDVLVTGQVPGANPQDGSRVRTLLQNIQVLSAGTHFQRDQESKPERAEVVTLLVTPAQAEVLSLASNETKIQLVLRNPMDTEVQRPPGLMVSELFSSSRTVKEAAGPVNPSLHSATSVSHAVSPTPATPNQFPNTPTQASVAAALPPSYGDRRAERLIAYAGEIQPDFGEAMMTRGRKTFATLPAAWLAVYPVLNPGGMIAASVPAEPLYRAAAESQVLARQESPTNLILTVGKSTLIESSHPIERVSVGYGDYADARAVSPSEVLVNAKTPGVTSLIIWEQGGVKRFYDVQVLPSQFLADSRVDAVQREIERELPGQNVNLSFSNDSAFLRGTVKDITSADRAVSIASTLGKTVNLLYVDVPPPEAQILLKVKFASVDRNFSQQLGVNILSTGATNTIGSVTTQQFSPPGAPSVKPNAPVASTISDALNLFFFRPDLNLGATIEALQGKGLLQILAEPNVLAENGQQGSFLAGGEFPFPSVSGGGAGGTPAVSIQFREFGVRLTFIPTITPRGTIQLQVAPEVSALDFTNGLSVSGFNVPALTTRKLSTQVELSEGQSFAIGGLLDNRTTDTIEKIPFLSEIPILGKFFQSKSVSKQNTELIVIVTPELVHPIPSGQALPGLKYSTPFMAPNSSLSPSSVDPVISHDNGQVPPPPPLTIPIETLIKSLRPILAPVPSMGTSGPAPASSATTSSK